MLLQRAASNAYSWWWASHIRTKQSKWLEQNLQDMEEKVANVLKLIEEDGDSFAKRAEMYYKKRPELINFVEESYKAYRALAERYDHISTELQNANTTIATVFPEQVPFAMDDDDEEATPTRFPEVPKANIPKVPKAPIKDLKSILSSTARKFQNKKTNKIPPKVPVVSRSGLSKPEALEKIDKLQKDILALQTVKEFVKSSYEGGLARFWEIEKQISDMQEEVSRLQDEFGEGMVIEDDEARTLMAAAALKSCQDTLASLREKQKRSAEETRTEQRRIREAFEKFRSLQKEFLPDQASECIGNELSDELEKSSLEEENVQDSEELKSIEEKVKEYFNNESNGSLTVMEMAERMDQLVNKVIGLETEVSSQHALIEKLRAEADDLLAQIQLLENEKASLAKGSDITIGQKMREVWEKFDGIQDLNRNVKQQNSFLQTHFTEAQCNLKNLSEKLHSVRPDDMQETTSPSRDVEPAVEDKSSTDLKGQENEAVGVNPNVKRHDIGLVEKQIDEMRISDSSEKKEETSAQAEPDKQRQVFSSGHDMNRVVDSTKDSHPSSEGDKPNSSPQGSSQKSDDNALQIEAQEQKTVEQDEPNWRELFMQGIEDREKTLLTEYTLILRNYKEVKKKLVEVEKNSQDGDFETTLQLKELKHANAMKDEEIRSLHQKLSLLQTVVEGNKDLNPKNLQELGMVRDQTAVSQAPQTLKTGPEQENDYAVKFILVDQPQETSEIEQKLRIHIDQLLEENLNFWLRFSASLHQIQKYETAVEDLQSEISKLEEKAKKLDSSPGSKTTLKSEMKPIYKHLRDIQTELTVWLEKCLLLKDEQQCRFSSLCNIQEEINKALKASAEDEEFKFTSYQAAKFQGEVLNMKQENNKVAGELQAGVDHIATLQAEVQKSLAKLDRELGILGPKDNKAPSMTQSFSKSRIPLRSFIFGVKQKRQRPSIFHYVSPAVHRKYNAFRSGFSGQQVSS